METFTEIVDAAAGIAGSDRKAAQRMGISQASFSAWRHGSHPTDEQALKLADLVSLDGAYVLALVRVNRAKTKQARATWARIADKFAKAAAVAVVTATPFLMLPPPAQAESGPGFNSNTDWTTRRRKWLLP
jgi:hypothetical protein